MAQLSFASMLILMLLLESSFTAWPKGCKLNTIYFIQINKIDFYIVVRSGKSKGKKQAVSVDNGKKDVEKCMQK